MPFTDLADEVATEVPLLRAVTAELAAHAEQREQVYRWADLGELARSLPGITEVGAPVLVAGMGRPGCCSSRELYLALRGLTAPGTRPNPGGVPMGIGRGWTTSQP